MIDLPCVRPLVHDEGPRFDCSAPLLWTASAWSFPVSDHNGGLRRRNDAWRSGHCIRSRSEAEPHHGPGLQLFRASASVMNQSTFMHSIRNWLSNASMKPSPVDVPARAKSRATPFAQARRSRSRLVFRGTLLMGATHERLNRLIPVGAGNPSRFVCLHERRSVHPRVCGERSSIARSCPWWWCS